MLNLLRAIRDESEATEPASASSAGVLEAFMGESPTLAAPRAVVAMPSVGGAAPAGHLESAEHVYVASEVNTPSLRDDDADETPACVQGNGGRLTSAPPFNTATAGSMHERANEARIEERRQRARAHEDPMLRI